MLGHFLAAKLSVGAGRFVVAIVLHEDERHRFYDHEIRIVEEGGPSSRWLAGSGTRSALEEGSPSILRVVLDAVSVNGKIGSQAIPP